MFNINRPVQIPTSLSKTNREYNCQDVLTALDAMSHSKCYICETKYPLAMAVEHFDADGDRYDWSNLLLACHRCNTNIKGAKYNELINPCDPNIDVVRTIRHNFPKGPNTEIKIEKAGEAQGADLTVELLNKVFNSDSTANRSITKAFLRKKVFGVSSKFYKAVFEYCDEDSTPNQKQQSKDQMIHFLRCEQEFSAFTRWVVLDDDDLRPDFEQYVI